MYQRGYLTPLSPRTYAQMKSSGHTDTFLLSILSAVHLAYLPVREGGWDTRKEWKDVLSGGERQRIGWARAFYWGRRWVVLDGEFGGLGNKGAG